jgi:cytochrome c-type biogenesis protein
MIDKEGNIMGYVAGALSKENMKKIIEMTLNNNK